jgi:hypothetical protein
LFNPVAPLLAPPLATGSALAMRRDHTVVWNHNRDSFWMKDDFLNLRANLKVKIDNFRRMVASQHSRSRIGHGL